MRNLLEEGISLSYLEIHSLGNAPPPQHERDQQIVTAWSQTLATDQQFITKGQGRTPKPTSHRKDGYRPNHIRRRRGGDDGTYQGGDSGPIPHTQGGVNPRKVKK